MIALVEEQEARLGIAQTCSALSGCAADRPAGAVGAPPTKFTPSGSRAGSRSHRRCQPRPESTSSWRLYVVLGEPSDQRQGSDGRAANPVASSAVSLTASEGGSP